VVSIVLINIFFGFGVWFMLSEQIMFAFFEPKLAGTIFLKEWMIVRM
jgi:hypothetical protein